MLVNRRQKQRISATLAKLGEASALSQRFLRRYDSVDEATGRIAASREVWLWGTTLSVHLPAFEDEIDCLGPYLFDPVSPQARDRQVHQRLGLE